MASNGESSMSGKAADGRGSGWNDPPASRYSNSPRGSIPRKRIPYPSQTNCTPTAVNHDVMNVAPSSQSSTLSSSNTVSPCVQLFPPLHGTDPASYTAPLIIPTLSGSSSEGSIATNPVTAASIAVMTSLPPAELDVPEFEDDEQMFHYVVTRLQRALKDCQHTTDPRAAAEMLKKVNVLSDMWKNGKISYPVKSTMARLATAIHKRHCDAANDLLTSLMVDHVSEVSRWLVGVKRLVHEVQNVEAPLSPSFDCHGDTKVVSLSCDNCATVSAAAVSETLPAVSGSDVDVVSAETTMSVSSLVDEDVTKEPISDTAHSLPPSDTQLPYVTSTDTVTVDS